MGNYFKWIAGIIAAYFLLDDNKAAIPTKPPTSVPPTSTTFQPVYFAPPLEPMRMRNDTLGAGHFGARRRKVVNGVEVRYEHRGLDLKSMYKYQSVKSPITGYIKRYAHPYESDLKWEGCLIIGEGIYTGYTVKMFYMMPNMIGVPVRAGQNIGQMQNISEKHGRAMDNHLHIEIRKNGFLLDPAIFLLQGEPIA